MTTTFTIYGHLPGLNEYTSACRTCPQVGNRMKRTAQAQVAWHIRQQVPGISFHKKVGISYRFYEPNERRDIDNVASFAMKVTQDAMVAEKLITDDSRKYVRGFTCEFFTDKKHPRIEVTVTDEEDANHAAS